MEKAGQIPEVLTGVKQINDLNSARKVFAGDIPDPVGPVADDNLFLCAAPTTVPSVQVYAPTEFGGSFDGSGVGRRIGIADGITFLVPFGLCENATQFYFARMRGLAFDLAFPALGLCRRHSGTVHLDIQVEDRLAHYHGEIQLHGPAYPLPLARADVFAYGLRRSLHGFGGDFQAGQQLHLLTCPLEGRGLSHHS